MNISEVSRLYDLTADTLRYYERVGLIPPVGRSRGGIREYGESDCRWIELIKCLRGAGLPIETLIEYVSLFQQGDSTLEARKALLTEQRALLAERIAVMQATLARLDTKIARYEHQSATGGKPSDSSAASTGGAPGRRLVAGGKPSTDSSASTGSAPGH